jgi:hypothetical protein
VTSAIEENETPPTTRIAFRDEFLNQETLTARFGQLAELRNAVRHSRTLDEIVEKDGEASIMWFEKVLNKSRAD